MIKTIIKRNGRKEPFTASKLNGWGQWGARSLGDAVDWSSVVIQTVGTLPEECSSEDLQKALIRHCLDEDSWSYNRMAGRLYAALCHKEIADRFNGAFPSVAAVHAELAQLGYMEKLDYSAAEYAQVEQMIDHTRDFTYAHYQLHTHLSKYAISDRVRGITYETSQFMYMRMAMALASDQPRERRMTDVAKFYEHLSKNRINAPTPNHVNLGTPLRGYASCCLYTTLDTARSIATGNHIANTMTYMSAGIGSHMSIRSVNDPVRKGAIRHQGKLPYLRAVVAEVKSSLQNGRGGACTSYFSVFDPEIDVLLRLKNPMSTVDRRIRGMDYSWGANRFFARKVARNEEIFLFNCFTAPALYKALYSDDEAEFERLYAACEADPQFKKTYVNAREILITASNEWNETGRIYEHNLHEMNHHTPFKDTIYSSNLCSEIALPTSGYNQVTELYEAGDISTLEFEEPDGTRGILRQDQIKDIDLYTLRAGDTVPDGRHIARVISFSSPEVATCNLAGIVVPNIESEAQYAEVAYYALLMIDKCIHLAHYELPQIGYTARARMNAGVGILGLAHLMARAGKHYSDPAGKRLVHEVAERHYYHLLRASLRLGKELGNAPWMSRTKWPQGWLPIDTFNQNVSGLDNFQNRYDWEALRAEIVANGGIRNSVLVAHMPTETSANASGTTNGVYPIRDYTLIKTDNNRVSYWAAPEGDLLKDGYELSWNVSAKDLTDIYAIIQKWTDQGISADFYRKVIGDASITSSEMIQNYLYRVKMGLKSKYYMNQKTSAGMKQPIVASGETAVQTPAPKAPSADESIQESGAQVLLPVPEMSVMDGDPICVGACSL